MPTPTPIRKTSSRKKDDAIFYMRMRADEIANTMMERAIEGGDNQMLALCAQYALGKPINKTSKVELPDHVKNAALLDKPQEILALVESGEISMEAGSQMMKMVDEVLTAGQLKLLQQFLAEISMPNSNPGEVARRFLPRLRGLMDDQPAADNVTRLKPRTPAFLE
jgi:hypothetical protein